MRKLTLTLLLVSVIVFSFGQDLLDGYMKGKSNLDIALAGMLDKSSTLYRGYDASPGQRTTTSLNLFTAYGLTNRLDVVASIPYVSVTSNEGSFQDGSLYLRAKLGEINIIGKTKIRFMLGGGVSTPLSDYVATSPTAIGQRATAYDTRGIVQAEFSNGIFAMFQSGYTFKKAPVPNALPINARIGYTHGKWYCHLAFSSIHAQSGIDYPVASQKFRKLAFSTQNIGAMVYYGYKHNLGFFGGTNQTITGRNAFKSNAFSIGFVWKKSPKKNN